MRRLSLVALLGGALIWPAGCGRSPSPVRADNSAERLLEVDPAGAPPVVDDGPPMPAYVPPVQIPVGSTIRVRLLETVGTRMNGAGERFTATLVEPLVSGNRVVVPRGTVFTGHLTESKRSGRFKGRAYIGLSLDSFQMRGRTYTLRTGSSVRASGGHKKRNWLWMGGGSAGGSLIGGIAAGAKGALIGAGAGAAAGVTGALFTGRKDVTLPVESRVSFVLRTPVVIG